MASMVPCRSPLAAIGLLTLLLTACGDGEAEAPPNEPATVATAASTTTTTNAPATGDEGCAHVIAGAVVWNGATATVSATVRSADTGWDKYADAWEVRTLDGTVLGVRELAHPHETEQPFTRSLGGVSIPTGVDEVELAARDSVVGWCGDTLVVLVPDRS